MSAEQPATARIAPAVSAADLDVILDALDSHEYWQLGDGLPRNNGMVWLPGDAVDAMDRYWGDETPTGDEQGAIRAIKFCRDLADRRRAER